MSAEKEILSRVDELESQMAFQDESHSQLSDIVARQDLEITRLKQQVTELVRRLREMGDSLPGAASGQAEETPPHY
ncbi:MAG: SlyX protein [Lysobacterales bacterium]